MSDSDKPKLMFLESLKITISKASLPSFLILFLIFIVYSAIDLKNSKRLVNVSHSFEQSLKENAESKKKGSEIGMANQFSSARDGFVELYNRYFDQNATEKEKGDLERMALLFKLPILKRTIAAQFERRNYSFEILNLRETVKYAKDFLSSQKAVSIKAKYDLLMDIQKDHSFNLYIVPGMSIINPDNIFTGNFHVEINGTKKEISFMECEKSILGSKETPSPLIEYKIKFNDIKDGDIIKIDFALPPVKQSGDTIIGRIPFSLYDVQVERYPKGIKELHTTLEFKEKVWIEGIGFDMQNYSHHSLNKADIRFIYPKKFAWTFSSEKYEFLMHNPREPFAIAFYKYQNQIIK